MNKPLMLHLERNGETKIVSFKLTPVEATKKIREIRRAMKEKWRLVDVTGGTKQIREYLKDEIKRYDMNPKKYRVSAKQTVKHAFKAFKGKKVKEKELMEAMKENG